MAKKPENLSLKEIIAHYETAEEANRLLSGRGQLERIRTQQILAKFLPEPPAGILDVGGAAGVYAFPLAKQGYEIHLIDPVPLHIQQAKKEESKQNHPLADIRLGDARKIEKPDNSADAVLFFGPLYHLPKREDRLQALREACRTLKKGGLLFAVGISRFASFMDGYSRGLVEDPKFVAIMEQDLKDGQHRNPTDKSEYFTTAFLHHPQELRTELEEAGFNVLALVGVEGPVWNLSAIDAYWEDSVKRHQLLGFLEKIETETSLIGASAHMMAVGLK